MSLAGIARRIAVILGSALFIPVSCTTGSVGFALKYAHDTETPWAEAIARHSNLRERFHVVALPGMKGEAFSALTLSQLDEFRRSNAEAGFLMREDAGQLEPGDERFHYVYRYRVLARAPAEQEIEVEFTDGDEQTYSRYRATASEVTPVSQRYGPVDRGITMMALPSGFALALVLYVIGKFLRSLLRRKTSTPHENPPVDPH